MSNRVKYFFQAVEWFMGADKMNLSGIELFRGLLAAFFNTRF